MKKLAPFFVLASGILWGVIGLFVRRLNAMGLESMDIVAIRAIFTVILLFLYLLIFDRKMLKIRWKDVWCFVGTGVFSVVFFNFCYFKAITMTSLSVAAVLLYTAPAFVMILSAILFHERITGIKIGSVLITFVGCVFVTGVVGNTEQLSVSGILLGLGAGFGYALYSIFSRYALERGYQSLTITFYTFVFSLLGAIPLSNASAIVGECQEVRTMMFCVLFAIVSTVAPYLLYTRGLKDMENSRASIIASIEPVTATLLGVLVYRETLTIQQILGVVLVLGAIVMCNVKLGNRILICD